ncbi:hypothetical protein GOQ27_01350 [Clostridium sp. D2Q-11]|uniref:Uncharacterized protein n=1 Tax=Anaeromonas frigoriresistens TaxID=2683708 RepID=A0A942UUI8_9FIRM|nr:hypothetical protein [Anaeromonas frigoriresistens]MBS4537086.1 hypothetical protein [Anaeromonas frigoriresistens]
MDNFNNEPVNKNHNGNNYPNPRNNEEVVSVLSWMGVAIILAIPILNLIAIVAMAFMDINKNIKNFARASLILAGILIGFGILFGGCVAVVNSMY